MRDRIYTQPDHVEITERWVSLGDVDFDAIEITPTDRTVSFEDEA